MVSYKGIQVEPALEIQNYLTFCIRFSLLYQTTKFNLLKFTFLKQDKYGPNRCIFMKDRGNVLTKICSLGKKTVTWKWGLLW